MQTHVHVHRPLLQAAARAELRDLIRSALERHRDRILSVQASLADDDGNRGPEKGCRLLVRLRRGGVAVFDRGATAFQAAGRAAERAARAIHRRVTRGRSLRRRSA